MYVLRILSFAVLAMFMQACNETAGAQSQTRAFRGVRIVSSAQVHASQADAVADGIAAVNTRFCDRTSGYTSFSDPNDATVRYLVAGGFRHIRDGGTNCEADTAFASFANQLYHAHAIDMLSSISPCASNAQIHNLFALFPGTRAVEGPNEYDFSKPSVFGTALTGRGSKEISVSGDARTNFSVGQTYLYGEGALQEPVVVTQCANSHSISGEAPLRYEHVGGFSTNLTARASSGTLQLSVRDASHIRAGDWITVDCVSHSKVREVARVATVTKTSVELNSALHFDHANDAPVANSCLATSNGSVSDLVLLYRRIASVLRSDPKLAKVPILADSQAAQTDNAEFQGSGIERLENVGNLHDYPGQRNPGGADGDGTKGIGDEFLGCGPYGAYWYNMCAESLQFDFVRDGHFAKPVWTTEISYNVAPVGGPWNAAQHPIPDDVAVKYLPRLELYYLKNGHARIYWFELVDSASGCGNVFSEYGLVRRDCPSGAIRGPKPEYNALSDMISLFTDSACRYPTCTFHPGSTMVSGISEDRTLQYDLFEKRNGNYTLAFWLERPGYDADATGPCHADLSCYVAVPPAKVSFAIQGSGRFEKPTLRTFETRPSAGRFGHLTAAVPTVIPASGMWSGIATDTVQFLSWRGMRP